MRLIEDFYEVLPEPIQVEAHFTGGPFDGKVTTLTVKRVLDKTVSIVMRDKSIYRFREPYVFEFDGFQPEPEPEPVPTLPQRVKARILRWLLT